MYSHRCAVPQPANKVYISCSPRPTSCISSDCHHLKPTLPASPSGQTASPPLLLFLLLLTTLLVTCYLLFLCARSLSAVGPRQGAPSHDGADRGPRAHVRRAEAVGPGLRGCHAPSHRR